MMRPRPCRTGRKSKKEREELYHWIRPHGLRVRGSEEGEGKAEVVGSEGAVGVVVGIGKVQILTNP